MDSGRQMRKEMANYVRARHREVAGVRVEQIEIRKSIHLLEETIVADQIRAQQQSSKEGDDALG